MAFDPLFKMSIQDLNGNYYSATQNSDATWTVITTSAVQYLGTLPAGWQDTAITWERDPSYLGVFRSKTAGTYQFSKDGRAIVQNIRSAGGIQGYGVLTIYMFNQQTFNYDTFYQSQFDFTTYRDVHWQLLTEIGTLDSGLIRDLHAYGDTVFNIPIWQGTTGAWTTNAAWVVDDGVKLLYQANYTSSATSNPLTFPNNVLWYVNSPVSGYSAGNTQLSGWNNGAIGDGYHIVPVMQQYNIVQNNGATTFIGNDVLEPFLIQGNQVPGAANFASEDNFAGINHSQPYSRNNYCLKNLLQNTSNGNGTAMISASVTFKFNGSLTNPNTPGTINTTGGGSATGRYLAFCLFEINGGGFASDPTQGSLLDRPLIYGGSGAGRYYTPGMGGGGAMLCKILLPNSPTTYNVPVAGAATPATSQTPATPGYSPIVLPDPNDGTGSVSLPVTFQINYDKVYVLGIICDIDGGGGSAIACNFGLDYLALTIESVYDNGASGAPIPAPSLNPSVYAGYRPHQLMGLLTNYLASRNADIYGFPILPAVNPYTSSSNYLSNPAQPAVGDGVPYQTIITSEYCLHDLQGQSYLSLSLNQLFDFCKKVWGCGMGVIGNALTMENLGYYFDNTTMILDLGNNVAQLEIEHVQEGIGANLKLGYTKADTNTDFGVDSFITELYYNTPASNISEVMDYEEGSIACDQYQKEKARAQQVNQPVGTGYDPANPSNDNQPYAVYCVASPLATLPSGTYNFTPYDPDNNAYYLATPYRILTYNGVNNAPGACAQNTDATAASAPYINGLYYPDSAQNIPLSPCRALQRDLGALIHSVLDEMDTEYLTFRQTGVMQYNNVALALNGIESNVEVGAGAQPITEMADILIGNLPPQLFKPILIRVKSKYPVNMYTILNSNPYGYIRFFWQEPGFNTKEYKFFLSKITQSAGNQQATEFEGWATPDMVI